MTARRRRLRHGPSVRWRERAPTLGRRRVATQRRMRAACVALAPSVCYPCAACVTCRERGNAPLIVLGGRVGRVGGRRAGAALHAQAPRSSAVRRRRGVSAREDTGRRRGVRRHRGGAHGSRAQQRHRLAAERLPSLGSDAGPRQQSQPPARHHPGAARERARLQGPPDQDLGERVRSQPGRGRPAVPQRRDQVLAAVGGEPLRGGRRRAAPVSGRSGTYPADLAAAQPPQHRGDPAVPDLVRPARRRARRALQGIRARRQQRADLEDRRLLLPRPGHGPRDPPPDQGDPPRVRARSRRARPAVADAVRRRHRRARQGGGDEAVHRARRQHRRV